MAFLLSGSGTTQGLRNGVILKQEWAEVRDKVTQMYMAERKTLKTVMSCMKLEGFIATYDLCYLLPPPRRSYRKRPPHIEPD
jgi:hypothetical protein